MLIITSVNFTFAFYANILPQNFVLWQLSAQTGANGCQKSCYLNLHLPIITCILFTCFTPGGLTVDWNHCCDDSAYNYLFNFSFVCLELK